MDGMPQTDTRALRRAFGRFATGVTVVTVSDGSGGGLGFTANSFTSVSLDPPLILWCIDRACDRFAPFHDAQYFAVNILSANQRPVSDRFAKDGPVTLKESGYETGPQGVPLIHGAAAHFQCETHARYPGGDHVILVGRVLRFSSDPAQPTLTFADGRYGMSPPRQTT